MFLQNVKYLYTKKHEWSHIPKSHILTIQCKESQVSHFILFLILEKTHLRKSTYNICTSYAHKYTSKLTKLICLHNFADNIKSNMA